MWMSYHRQPSVFAKKKRPVVDDNIAIPGFLLKRPNTEILHPENKQFGDIEIGHASMQGYRVNMEDEHVIDHLHLKDHLLVAVMDGHAGTYAAKYVARSLKIVLESTEEWMKYHDHKARSSAEAVQLLATALLQTYLKLDEEMLEMARLGLMTDESGCTCVTTIITPSHIVCASVGDSRCVIGGPTSAISLTEDHKPKDQDEKARIKKANGFVKFNRVNGELAMSRALGDFRYKLNFELPVHEQQVIAVPDIAIHERSPDDRVAVLACDGVWDVIQNEESIEFLTEIVFAKESEAVENSEEDDKKKKKKRKADSEEVTALEAAQNLIELALLDGSQDNITAIVVKFPGLQNNK